MSGTAPKTHHSSPIRSQTSEHAAENIQVMPMANQAATTIRIPTCIRAVKNSQSYKPKGRTILVFLDGTGDQFDSDNSNIVHLVSCLRKADPSQISYYQTGIGTYGAGGLSNGVSAAVDMAVGSGLGVHIRDAYKFLMQNYKEGDKVCLFGFSRGAYTARCLAGMIHKVGLLPAHNIAQIPFAYKFYKDDTQQGWDMSLGFKRTFCMELSVYFIGVFDSVASVGFIPRKLPLSSTPTSKSTYFRHAMGLDEHRAKFKACRYKRLDHVAAKPEWTTVAEEHGTSQENRRLENQMPPSDGFSSVSSGATKDEKIGQNDRVPLSESNSDAFETNALEVWFTGCHADVGGGAVKNEVRHKLSNIPLRWMIRQCFECDTGIIFHTDRLAEKGLDVQTLWPAYTSLVEPKTGPPPAVIQKYKNGKLGPIIHRAKTLKAESKDDPSGEKYYEFKIWEDEAKKAHVPHWLPEQQEDYFDSLADINDQLVQAKGWWILEVWPIKVRVQPSHTDDWVKKVAFNLGRYRPVQEVDPNLHWTVQQRIKIKDYKIRTRVDKNATWNTTV